MKETKVTLKKIVLSIFMCLALALGIMPVEEVKATNTTSPSINTSQTGSITIHKYEYNNTNGKTGTGASSDENTFTKDNPNTDEIEGAKPLQGAKFTIYKVEDAAWIQDYYDGDAKVGGVEITDLEWETYYEWNDSTGEGDFRNGKTGDEIETIETNATGEAFKTGLAVGLYLVVEKEAPAKVTKKAEPFLVSLPLTIDNNAWLYDVHVYPKNETSYGKVTLEKKGVSNVSDTVDLENVKFVLQIYDANTDTWSNVTERADTGVALTLTTDTNGEIVVEGLSQGKYRFIEEENPNSGYILDGKTTYEFTVDAEQKISYIPPAGSGGTTITKETNATITINNYKPTVTKEVEKKVSGGSQKTYDADYSANDIITYKVKVYVPENVGELDKFELVDTPTNLEDLVSTNDTVTVTCDSTSLTRNTDYTITKEGNGFKFVLTDAGEQKCKGKELTIEYKAKLEENPNTTTTGNVNTIALTYNNYIEPDSDYTGVTPPTEPESETTTKDEAVVYSFDLELIKKNEDGEKLSGATFGLYGKYVDGITDAGENNSKKISKDEADTLGLPDTDTTTYVKIGEGTSASSTGNITFSGLSNGTYYLVETKAPESYNLLSEPVTVNINYTYDTGTEVPADISNGIYVKKIKTASTTFTGATGTNLVYTDNGKATITIVNRKGFTLPTTGGAGSFLFTLIGCAIMIGGFIIFRKTSAKKSDVA